MWEASSRARASRHRPDHDQPGDGKTGEALLAVQALAISRCLGVGSAGSWRWRELPGRERPTQRNRLASAQIGKPLKSERDATAAASVKRKLGVETNRRRLSVAGSLGAAGASVMRTLGTAPTRPARTDSRAACGTNKLWVMLPSVATTSATSSVTCGKPASPAQAADTWACSRLAGNLIDSRTRLALIFSARTASWTAIPASMVTPLPAAMRAGRSVFTATLTLPALGLTFRGLSIEAALAQHPFGLEPQHQTKLSTSSPSSRLTPVTLIRRAFPIE